jgi:hypothetical protein
MALPALSNCCRWPSNSFIGCHARCAPVDVSAALNGRRRMQTAIRSSVLDESAAAADAAAIGLLNYESRGGGIRQRTGLCESRSRVDRPTGEKELGLCTIPTSSHFGHASTALPFNSTALNNYRSLVSCHELRLPITQVPRFSTRPAEQNLNRSRDTTKACLSTIADRHRVADRAES